MKNFRAAKKRLERIESRLAVGGELEDLRAVEIFLYGEPALDEIRRLEGIGSLCQLLEDDTLDTETHNLIFHYIRRHENAGHKKEE